jgi:uncharacterized protein YgbK (DUF1537 family)
MTLLRLIADDLTGALDTAAEFVGLCGLLDVAWTSALPPKPRQSLAIDAGTREVARLEAIAVLESIAPWLSGADIAYKKVDSMLRGSWAAELGACLRAGEWQHCVVAPAFAYQGRRTVGAQQFTRAEDGSWSPVGDNILQALKNEGLDARLGQADQALLPGISVFDAETDEDLLEIAALGRTARAPLLWCGSGGLARALAHGSGVTASSRLELPVLGIFGSDQRATAAQLDSCRPSWLELPPEADENAARITQLVSSRGLAMVSFELPNGTTRVAAAMKLSAALAVLLPRLEPPGTLIVAGGETLRAICSSLGTRSLRATGQVMPGLPRSVMQGGAWDGVEIISKSGAFGSPTLWRSLFEENDLILKRELS